MAITASLLDSARSSFISGDKLPASSSFSSSCWSNSSTTRTRAGARRTQASAAIDSHLVLGLDHSASKQEIKRAYRNLARQYHPDVCKGNGCEHVFTQINLAYECLMKSGEEQSARVEDPSFGSNTPRRTGGTVWMSEGYTFEEIFGTSPSYTVDGSLFAGPKDRPRKKTVKKGSSREDW